MTSHDLSDENAAARLEPLVRQAVAESGLAPDSALTLLNVSENATYAVDDAASGQRTVLRVHRHGYHDVTAIESELAWLDSVRDQAGLRTPRVLAAPDGRRVLALHEDGAQDPRYVVRFEWLPGAEPTPADRGLPQWFEVLGSITARLHRHARTWQPPPGFRRFAWDYAAAFGSVARWGRWEDGIAVGPGEHAVLSRLDQTLRRRLAAYGCARERYGLIHADLRLANLLVHGDETYLIDFDDCGDGWFVYDFGAAVSFFEHDPRIPELADAWVRGYRSADPLSAADEAEIPTFVMMRRLLLVAWIGSHAGTDLAASMGAQYTATSCELAEQYLSRFG
jgi:Ser/Thr protein kinase RdoA (MazF antagonist)